MPKKTKAKARTRGKAKAKAPARAVTAVDRKRAILIMEALEKEFPEAGCALDFTTPLELLVATIMAAQCTDVRVNMVTKTMFKKYRGAQDFVDVPGEELEEDIRSTGFFRNKTKSIKKCCQALIDNFGGEVPSSMEELLSLAGVGRKTANCLLGNVFGVPSIVVDTHMLRLSRRMGFSQETNPDKVELDMRAVVPEKQWTRFSHLIEFHGRKWCSARKPLCDQCPVADFCPQLL